MINRVHVIDGHVRRRARVARELSTRGLHTEIYEDLNEFSSLAPTSGALFTADDLVDVPSRHLVVKLKESAGTLPVVLYSENISAPRVVEAVLEGALDYLQWPFDAGVLEGTFKRLATEGERRGQQAHLREAAKAKIATLTRRERQVLILLVQGLSNKDMAETLGISPRTIEIHRGHMMDRLGARSASDAVRIAIYADVDVGTEPVGLRAVA